MFSARIATAFLIGCLSPTLVLSQMASGDSEGVRRAVLHILVGLYEGDSQKHAARGVQVWLLDSARFGAVSRRADDVA